MISNFCLKLSKNCQFCLKTSNFYKIVAKYLLNWLCIFLLLQMQIALAKRLCGSVHRALCSEKKSGRRTPETWKLFVVNREHLHKHASGCSCLPALQEGFSANPLFPALEKLRQSIRKSVLSTDVLATSLPIFIENIRFLPNKMRLLLAGNGKHPENIVQGVQHAATTYMNRLWLILRSAATRLSGCRSAAARRPRAGPLCDCSSSSSRIPAAAVARAASSCIELIARRSRLSGRPKGLI